MDQNQKQQDEAQQLAAELQRSPLAAKMQEAFNLLDKATAALPLTREQHMGLQQQFAQAGQIARAGIEDQIRTNRSLGEDRARLESELRAKDAELVALRTSAGANR